MSTETIKLSPSNYDRDILERAAQRLESGQLVVFPTETVYGIGCRVEPEALERLNKLKSRPAGRPYTLHVGKQTDIHKYLPDVRLKAQKLIKNTWPGPVTIIFELTARQMEKQRQKLSAGVVDILYHQQSLGVRCVENRIASHLLQLASCPVVAPSANLADQKPAVTAQQALENLHGKVDLVLDGGRCKYQKPSSVTKVHSSHLEVLREGVYSLTELQEMSVVEFLFVCTGNTCRSPMAAGIFRHELAKKLGTDVDLLEQIGYKVASAGIMERTGFPATAQAIAACGHKGIDISSHRSQPVSRRLIEQSDLIFVMTASHYHQLVNFAPEAGDKCQLLADDKDIADPIGQPVEAYDRCADFIEQSIRKRIYELSL